MRNFDPDTIAIAAIKTLALVRERRPGIEPYRFVGHGEAAGTCPVSTEGRIADALYTLENIPSQIKRDMVDKAFYALAAAQTMLWVVGVFIGDEIGTINEAADKATFSMA
ncbi:MAG: hypothetical protein JWM46_558 [Candidatus Kaiserbacteria bacterium]|nr:hypothetical protein [Candidatus Kaiserbacteria bacterium]